MDASIIVTYRCPMRCKMCNIWDNPTKVSEEFKPELLEKLPKVDTVNITGGEPFVREDIEDIVKILFTKTKRIVFSTSGYYSDRIIQLARKYPQLGFRISIEGLSCKNDELRGRPGGFDKGLKTLLELRRMGSDTRASMPRAGLQVKPYTPKTSSRRTSTMRSSGYHTSTPISCGTFPMP